MTETWRPVAGWPYEVSDLGRVRRVGGRVLAQATCTNGYRQVGLYAAPRTWRALVHRLVAAAFLGPCSDGYEVNHRDGDKGHNAVGNLQYVTRAENMAHAASSGFMSRGCACGRELRSRPSVPRRSRGMARLAARDVLVLRRMVRICKTNAWRVSSAHAARLGVSASTLHQAITGRSWKSLPGATYAWDSQRPAAKRLVYASAPPAASLAGEVVA